MIDLVKNIFNLLIGEVQLESDSIEKLRLMPEVNNEVACFNMQFCKSATVLTKNSSANYVLNNSKVCLAEFNSEKYILITGINERELDEASDLTEYEIDLLPITGGLLLLFHSFIKLRLNINYSTDERIEKLLSQQESDDYVGHEVEDIIPFIEDFCIFKISINSAFSEMQDFEIAYYILCNFSKKFVHLELDNAILNQYKLNIKDGYHSFKENIFLSLTSAHYKHAFIELYRCIEVFYGIPKAIKLKASINYDKSAYELSKICYKDLTWKNPERDSIKAIFSEIDQNIIINNSKFLSLVGINIVNNDSKEIEKVADYIYQIRNQLVHQLDSALEKEISVDNWKVLLLFLLDTISGTYEKYKNELPLKGS